MSKIRGNFSKDFKAKVVLEALKERNTLETLAKKIRVATDSNFKMEDGSIE
jgi:hypothetical protein